MQINANSTYSTKQNIWLLATKRIRKTSQPLAIFKKPVCITVCQSLIVARNSSCQFWWDIVLSMASVNFTLTPASPCHHICTNGISVNCPLARLQSLVLISCNQLPKWKQLFHWNSTKMEAKHLGGFKFYNLLYSRVSPFHEINIILHILLQPLTLWLKYLLYLSDVKEKR